MKTVTRYMKQERREAAEERDAAYKPLSLDDKLARLPPDGAKRQRARLLALKNDKKTESS